MPDQPLDDNPQLRQTIDETAKMIYTASASPSRKAWMLKKQADVLRAVGGPEAGIYLLDEFLRLAKRADRREG